MFNYVNKKISTLNVLREPKFYEHNCFYYIETDALKIKQVKPANGRKYITFNGKKIEDFNASDFEKTLLLLKNFSPKTIAQSKNKQILNSSLNLCREEFNKHV
jgi:hypothetical protein